ncbi:hypothetical protein NUSPORA_02420 [Nucleospora cyclopteri]
MFTVKEQDKLFQNYTNPFKFIQDFVELYTIQGNCIYKLFPQDTPYYEMFQNDLLTDVIKNTEKGNLDRLKELLDVLEKVKYEFNTFYDFCLKTIYKGINIWLHKVEWEILKGKYENIRFLYEFTLFNIDLSRVLARRALKFTNITEMLLELEKVKLDVEIINEHIKNMTVLKCLTSLDSSMPLLDQEFLLTRGFEITDVKSSFSKKINRTFSTKKLKKNFSHQINEELQKQKEKKVENTNKVNLIDKEVLNKNGNDLISQNYSYVIYSETAIKKSFLFVKTGISAQLLGTKRILKYNFLLVLRVFVEEFINFHAKSPASEAYVSIMDLSCEINKYEGAESLIKTMKEYARYLLVENNNKIN